VRAAQLIFERLEGKLPTATTATVDFSYQPSDVGRCEGMVSDLMLEAEQAGRPISRSEAITLLSKFDSKVGLVLGGSNNE
jgi:hypothetical protein